MSGAVKVPKLGDATSPETRAKAGLALSIVAVRDLVFC